MSLAYIIREVSGPIGLTDLELNASQRSWLISKINAAAEEVYESDDLPGCLREAYILVTPNSEIALPEFVGRLRAVREAFLKRPYTLQDMRPRYHVSNWANEWNKFVYKGTSAIKFDVVNAAPPVATISVANENLTLTIVGSTIDSNRTSETVTMDAVSKSFTKSFISYESIEKNILGDYNITIKDSQGNELAVIFNDQLKSHYELYDISAYPWGGNCVGNQNVVEILYKLPLKQLANDSDNFPIDGFDNIIVNKTLQLIAETQEGKEERAILANAKTAQLTRQKIEDRSGQTEKVLNYPRRKTLGLFSWQNWYE